MKILIVGCGYIGTALGEKFISLGSQVWGLRRDEGALKAIAAKGISPVQADLLLPETLKSLPGADVVVLCQGLSRKTDNYGDTYERGTVNLISALQGMKPKKIISISSTSVYSTHDGSWVDEATDPAAMGYESKESEQNAASLLAAEKAVLTSGTPSNVFRLAGIYGPGRNRMRLLREGRMAPSFSEIYTNRIHRDDIFSGIMLLMEKGKPGEIYIGADDYPSTQKEFYSWIYGQLNLKIPENIPSETEKRMHVSNRRCSNKKIKTLGLVLKYPSFKEGYAELIHE